MYRQFLYRLTIIWHFVSTVYLRFSYDLATVPLHLVVGAGIAQSV
jgi:hypothetical protein